MSSADDIRLGTVGNGGLETRFQLAVHEALKNLRDPNTKANAPRKITIEVVLLATHDRQINGTTYQVKTKLPPYEPGVASTYVREEKDGTLRLMQVTDTDFDDDPRQERVPDDTGGGNVANIKRSRG